MWDATAPHSSIPHKRSILSQQLAMSLNKITL